MFQGLSPSRPGTTLSNYRDHDRDGREPHPVTCVLPHFRVARANSRSNAPARPGRESGKRPSQQQPASDETLAQLEPRAIQASSLSLSSTPSAQCTPPHPSSRLNDFGRRGELDVRGSRVGAKCESGMAAKKAMVRVCRGRYYGTSAELPDENERNVQHSAGDDEILEVHRMEMTMAQMMERGQVEKRRYGPFLPHVRLVL